MDLDSLTILIFKIEIFTINIFVEILDTEH